MPAKPPPKPKAVVASAAPPAESSDSVELVRQGSPPRTHGKSRIRARVTEFAYPPVHDGVVIGKTAQLGLAAFRKALDLLVAVPFVHVHVEDDVVGDILIRHAILRRVTQPQLISFVMHKIKPLMSSEEILHLDLHVEIELEDDFA